MRYRLLASYQGAPYEAGVGPDETGVVLFAACPPPEELQFEPATGHWRKEVSRADVQMLYESRPVGTFRGERCVVLDDLTDRLHIAYLGHDAHRAERLGFWEVDRGVFELITQRQEVTDIVEQRLPLAPPGDGTPPDTSPAGSGWSAGYGQEMANGSGPGSLPMGRGVSPDRRSPGYPGEARDGLAEFARDGLAQLTGDGQVGGQGPASQAPVRLIDPFDVSIPAVDQQLLPLEAEARRAATAAGRRDQRGQDAAPGARRTTAADPAAHVSPQPPVPVTPAGISEPSTGMQHGADAASAVPSWTPKAPTPPQRPSQVEAPQAEAAQAEAPQAEAPQAEAPQAEFTQPATAQPATAARPVETPRLAEALGLDVTARPAEAPRPDGLTVGSANSHGAQPAGRPAEAPQRTEVRQAAEVREPSDGPMTAGPALPPEPPRPAAPQATATQATAARATPAQATAAQATAAQARQVPQATQARQQARQAAAGQMPQQPVLGQQAPAQAQAAPPQAQPAPPQAQPAPPQAQPAPPQAQPAPPQAQPAPPQAQPAPPQAQAAPLQAQAAPPQAQAVSVQAQAAALIESALIHGVPLPPPAEIPRQPAPGPAPPREPAPGQHGALNGATFDGQPATEAPYGPLPIEDYRTGRPELPLAAPTGLDVAAVPSGPPPVASAALAGDEQRQFGGVALASPPQQRREPRRQDELSTSSSHHSEALVQPAPRRRRASRRRLPTQRIFSDLAAQAGIPASAYAIGQDIDGAMCLVRTDEGFEVFNSLAGARHEVRVFQDEESAYFYLFGVLVAEAVRAGVLVPRHG